MIGGLLMKKTVPIALSNRHIHLSQKDLESLFGKGYELKKLKDLSQPGQYASQETVDAVGPKGEIKGIRILGPVREETQMEISISDSFKLGIKAEIRNSGETKETPGLKLIGPEGEVSIDRGVIVAARHIHMNNADAEKLGVEDKDCVKVKVGGPRGLIFDEVLVRVNDDYSLEMHVDVEEGNACGVKNCDLVEIIN